VLKVSKELKVVVDQQEHKVLKDHKGQQDHLTKD
jgi:hypothetical protein